MISVHAEEESIAQLGRILPYWEFTAHTSRNPFNQEELTIWEATRDFGDSNRLEIMAESAAALLRRIWRIEDIEDEKARIIRREEQEDEESTTDRDRETDPSSV